MPNPVIPDTSGFDNGSGATFQPCGPTSAVTDFAETANAVTFIDALAMTGYAIAGVVIGLAFCWLLWGPKPSLKGDRG